MTINEGFREAYFLRKDTKKALSPSLVDWRKKQVKGRIDGEVKMYRFDELEFLCYDDEG